ncbi:MAG TPA: PH domain-containing protein, partial [Thermoanaerobaculia bacterium]|nr:PH domain-containing protein [Thermoanaerobaculia bacterium]
PLSILFGLAEQVRIFLIPGLLLLFTASRNGWSWSWWDWEAWPVWAMPLLIPYAIITLGRYFSFRYRYEANEMVIRTGFLFRNERHVPYARIQNLDAVQNVFHRLLGVVEVRVETGGGQKPEATLKVLPVAAFEEMQRRVFAGRTKESATAEPAAALEATGRTLLQLPLFELILCGLIQNRGVVIISAGFGLLWEMGILDGYFDRMFGETATGRGVIRDFVRSIFGQGGFPLSRIALALGALAGLLLLVRIFSMVLSLVRLYGFRLTRDGEDLRTEYGLLTRVVAAIPLGRIQSLTVLEGPLHQLFRRVSVRVETAGGTGGGEGEESNKTQREWLAPILRPAALPGLLHELLPELDFNKVEWNPAHPRAFRREYKGWIILAVLIPLPFIQMLKIWDLALLASILAWGFVAARIYVANIGWAVTDSAVLFRTGWIWKKLTIVRFAKIQAVALRESPFDRRAAMARVRVDTAGAGDASHRVDIPYLARETARELSNFLAARAARTAFRW